MIWIVVAVLVLILLVAVAVWLYQWKNIREIEAVDTEIATMDTGEITGLIRNIQQLGLAGESQRQFDDWEQQYQDLAGTNLTDLQSALFEVEQDNRQFRFRAVREQLDALHGLTDDTRATLQAINKGLRAIVASEGQNQQVMSNLRTAYEDARKTVLAKSFAYGEALSTLEERLKAIADELQTVQQVNTAGDHETAKEDLAALKRNLSSVQEQIAALPPLVNAVVNEFPEQLTEIKAGHARLVEQQYVFEEDLDATIKVVSTQMVKAQALIRVLDTAALAEQNELIADQIDHLYAVMEAELAAKPVVTAEVGDVRQFIAHAKKQNHTLVEELDHLNQSYTLNHNEIMAADQLKTRLVTLETNYQKLANALDAHKAVFSTAAKQLLETKDALHTIEVEQQRINAGVSDLRETEQKAVVQVQQFEQAVREIKHAVRRAQLPGLPKDYRDFYQVVMTELQRVNTDLDQVKIDLEAIAKQLIQLSEDIDSLRQRSRELVNAAGMTEQLLQYANRYKTNEQTVADAMAESQAAYKRFDYQGAADAIATALEQVEPGSYKKVEDDFLAGQKRALF